MFCFDRKFRLLLPCCSFKTTLKFKTFRFGMRAMLWGAWSVLYDSNPACDNFFAIGAFWVLILFFLSTYIIHAPVLMGKMYIRTCHTITHTIWYNIQTIIQYSKHEWHMYLLTAWNWNLPRYSKICIRISSVNTATRPFLHTSFFCPQSVELLSFLWLCPSGSFSFILRYSQSSTLEFVTIAGWVCCVSYMPHAQSWSCLAA